MQRIKSALQNLEAFRQYIFWGVGTSDSHFSSQTGELEFPAALERGLLNLGFQAIFTSPIQPYYSHLAENKQFFEPYLTSQSPKRILDAQLRNLQPGPLGDRFLLGTQEQLAPANELMGDNHVLRIFDSLLSGKHARPICLVVINAEATLRHLEDQRTLSGVLAKWNRLTSTNPNKILFCFDARNEATLRESIDDLQINAISNLLPSSGFPIGEFGQLRSIGSPNDEELSELIQARFQRKLRSSSPANLRRISKLIAGEGLPLSTWIPRINSLPELTKDSLRENNWLESSKKDSRPALDQLNGFVGMANVKTVINDLVKWASRIDHDRSEQKAPLLHMVFTGPPGVGKTTVARFLGEILHDCGLLQKGQLVVQSPTSLVADHIGGTARLVHQAVDSALGGVLFIDEAYGLADRDRGGFVQEAIETLMHRMEIDHGKFIVVLAGYQKQMVRLFRQNPGLDRRFPTEFRLRFAPYSSEELGSIFINIAHQEGFQITEELWEQLNRLFARITLANDETAGNAGEVKNLFEATCRKWRLRDTNNGSESPQVLDVSDLPNEYQRLIGFNTEEIKHAYQSLDCFLGLREVKVKLKRLAKLIEYEQHKRTIVNDFSWNLPTLHQVFVGNPGTGKTSIARLFGEMLKACGYLRKGHTVEVSAPLLISGYAGDSGSRLSSLIQEALDGVLFIDEAYALTRRPGSANFEVIDSLTKAIEDFRNRLVVVVAGYPQEMSEFLAGNPGLQSRFADPILFSDLTQQEMGELLGTYAVSEGYNLPGDVQRIAELKLVLQQRQEPEKFGNARSVKKLFDEMKKRLAERVLAQLEEKTGVVSVTAIPGWNVFSAEDVRDEGITFIVAADAPSTTVSGKPGIESWVMRTEDPLHS
ncbi:MAG: AAA family ATPase [Anaerolineaceae bacterium]|nr:AAA family ATPase [Anaerolineaceae bacterium]